MVWQMAHGDAHCDADAPDEEDVDRASRLSGLMQKSSAQCQALGLAYGPKLGKTSVCLSKIEIKIFGLKFKESI